MGNKGIGWLSSYKTRNSLYDKMCLQVLFSCAYKVKFGHSRSNSLICWCVWITWYIMSECVAFGINKQTKKSSASFSKGACWNLLSTLWPLTIYTKLPPSLLFFFSFSKCHRRCFQTKETDLTGRYKLEWLRIWNQWSMAMAGQGQGSRVVTLRVTLPTRKPEMPAKALAIDGCLGNNWEWHLILPTCDV